MLSDGLEDKGIDLLSELLDNDFGNLLLEDLSLKDFNRMSNAVNKRISEKKGKLLELRRTIDNQGVIINQVMDFLLNLDELYKKSSSEIKSKLLKAIFPLGFYIDQETQTCRTPLLNGVIAAISSKRRDYETILEMSHSLTKWRWRESNPRPVKALKSLLHA